MKKNNITGKEKLRTTGTVLLRAVLSFLVVFVIGMMGMAHYRSAGKSKSNDLRLATSGNMIESLRRGSALSHQVLKAEGISFDVTRKRVAGSLFNVQSQVSARKMGLGWRKIRVPDNNNPISTLNLTHKDDSFQFFLSPGNRISGYHFTQLDHTTKITEVSFDLNAVTKRLTGKGISIGKAPIVHAPERYTAIMPNKPIMSLESSALESSGIYVCSVANAQLADVAIQIDDKIKFNGWERELFGDIAEHNDILSQEKIIVARKNGMLCNIILSTDRNEIIVSYRFSKMRQAEIRR